MVAKDKRRASTGIIVTVPFHMRHSTPAVSLLVAWRGCLIPSPRGKIRRVSPQIYAPQQLGTVTARCPVHNNKNPIQHHVPKSVAEPRRANRQAH
jgi:hypothetical protein